MPVVRPGQFLSTQCRFAVGGQADFFVTVSDGDEMFTAFEFAFNRKLPTFVYSGGSNLFFDDAGFHGVVIRLRGGSWELSKRELPAELPSYHGRDSLNLNQPTDDLNGSGDSPTGGPLDSTPADAFAPSSSGFGKGWGEGLEDEDGSRQVKPYTWLESDSPSSSDAKLVEMPVVKVGGGFELGRLVRELSRLDKGGLEFLGNIPGSVAGAIAGNAGCYGRAIAEVLVEAEVYNLECHEVMTVEPEFFEFGYRHSKVKLDTQNYIVNATLRLIDRPRGEIVAEVDAELAERLRKHPHDAACAGSFFQNPSRERPAWKLIAEAGLSGTMVGAAQLSTKHNNFLINTGGATSTDIIRLARLTQRAVLETSGFELLPEVRYVGPEGLVDTLPDL